MTLAPEASRFPTATPALCVEDALADLPHAVISPLAATAELQAAIALGRTLPPIWRWCMLETRLSGASRQVDFMTCVADVARDREQVAAVLPRLSQAGLGNALWPLRAWASPATAELAEVPIVWLEWDMPGAKPSLPLVSACLDVSLLDPGRPATSRAVQQRIIAALVSQSYAEPDAARLCRGVERCLAALPPDARVLHVASLQARGIERLRLTLGLLPAELIAWLRVSEWPGDLREVSTWLQRLATPWQRVFFQVEMDERVHAHLSIETRTVSLAPRARDELSVILEPFERGGLVAPTLAGAVLAWPGQSAVTWQGAPAVLARSCYLKLVLSGGQASEVKAYLGMSRAPLRAPSARSA